MNISKNFSSSWDKKEHKPNSKQIWFMLGGIIVFALVLRILRLLELDELSRDEIFYLQSAEIWKQYGASALYTKSFLIPPLFFYFIKSVMYSGCSALVAGRIVSIICGVLFIFPMYWLGRLIFNDRKAALLLALLATVNPFTVRYSVLILRESANFFLVASALAFAFAALRYDSSRFWCFSAFFGGAAILMRHDSIIVIGVLLIFLFIGFIRDRSKWKYYLRSGIVFLLTLLITFSGFLWLMGIPFFYVGIYFNRLEFLLDYL